MSRKVRIKNTKESTITLQNLKLILRGKSTGHGEATVLIENIHQDSELNVLKRLGYITIDELSSKQKNGPKLAKPSPQNNKEPTLDELEKDEGRVIIMTNSGPNEVKKTINQLMDIPDDAKTQKSINAAKEYENSDDYVEDNIKPADVATVALGKNQFQKVELKHSILPDAQKTNNKQPENAKSMEVSGETIVKNNATKQKATKVTKAAKETKVAKADKADKVAKSSKPKSIKAVGHVRVIDTPSEIGTTLFTEHSSPDCFIDT